MLPIICINNVYANTYGFLENNTTQIIIYKASSDTYYLLENNVSVGAVKLVASDYGVTGVIVQGVDNSGNVLSDGVKRYSYNNGWNYEKTIMQFGEMDINNIQFVDCNEGVNMKGTSELYKDSNDKVYFPTNNNTGITIELKTGHYLIYDSENNEKVTLKCEGKNAKFKVSRFENNYLFEDIYTYNKDVYFDFTTLDSWAWVRLELISINGEEESDDYVEVVGNTDGELIEPPSNVTHVTQSIPVDNKNRMIIRNDNLDKAAFVKVRVKNDKYGQYGENYTHFYLTKETIKDGEKLRVIDSQSNLSNGEYKDIYLNAGYQLEVINARGSVTVEYDDNGYTSYELDSFQWDNYINPDIPFFGKTDGTNPIDPPIHDNVDNSVLGYLKWIFETITGLIGILADGIKTLWNSVGQMGSVMNDLFSFLPEKIRNILYLGVLVGIVLRIFGR